MLAYVPVVFDLYRPLAPRLRWTLQCLVAFADRAGKCWPSVRKLAEVTGIGKSSVSRHLAALVRAGVVSRSRKPGGAYTYQIDQRFLPAAAKVSHHRPHAVPPRPGIEEKPIKKTRDSALPDDKAQWEPRLRAWRKSGFWLPQWGAKPGEAGCFASVIREIPQSPTPKIPV